MHKLTFLFIFITVSSLISGCSKKETLIEPTAEQYTIIGGRLDTVLTASASPYMVTNNLIVDSSDILSIEPGVQVYFEDSTQLIVHGTLSCIGNSTQKILLTSKNVSWKGIQISETNTQSIIQFVIIENIDVTIPYDTIRSGAMEITNANLVIRNSIFRNNKSNDGGALIIDRSQSIITNNLFINNYAVTFGGAVISSASSNKIINNTFYGNRTTNYAGGLVLLSPVLDSVQNNIFYANTNATGNPGISLLQTDSSHYVNKYNFFDTGINPYFVSATDFHLAPASPCINAGNPDLEYNDVDGTRNDQGAYGGPSGNW
jgi:hypothetical protein